MMEEPERYRRFILSHLQEYRQQRFLRMYPSIVHGLRSGLEHVYGLLYMVDFSLTVCCSVT